MCGIVGLWNHQRTEHQLLSIINKMSSTLTHRGPDELGTWIDPTAGIGLGHQRLAILDLSTQGSQPMKSPNNQYILIFNGEIYNHQEIRQQLTSHGYSFRSHSDTEVILTGFTHWGIQNTLTRLVGMFAIALWDTTQQTLYLARDRFGEKPLYYGWNNNHTLLFASELKAILSYPHSTWTINRTALSLLLKYGYIKSPHTIYQEIRKLPPGHLLKITKDQPHLPPQPYWSLEETILQAIQNPFTGTQTEAIATLDQLLNQTIQQQMISDVPLGAFLSGGIDSSTIVSIMQQNSSHPIKTFTIGFHESGYNEAQHAKAIAQHLGTDHTELYITTQQAIQTIPQLPTLYDEPLGDPSQIPTFLLAQLAKKQVTVSLSGDGGDELFAGYQHYLWGQKIWSTIKQIPLRKTLAQKIQNLNPQHWTIFIGEALHRLTQILELSEPSNLYDILLSKWQPYEHCVITETQPSIIDNTFFLKNLPDVISQMMYIDTSAYLPDDILVKVDRATMGVSLESRSPFLDHRIAQFAWRLPPHFKIHNNQNKWILRQLLNKYLPNQLVDRPKMGFNIPLKHWLRTQLRDWAHQLLNREKIASQGYFNPDIIGQKWNQHLNQTHNWEKQLWPILMFQAWLN